MDSGSTEDISSQLFSTHDRPLVLISTHRNIVTFHTYPTYHKLPPHNSHLPHSLSTQPQTSPKPNKKSARPPRTAATSPSSQNTT